MSRLTKREKAELKLIAALTYEATRSRSEISKTLRKNQNCKV